MGIFDDLLGKTSEKASKAAAADTYAKQQNAISKLLGYGDEYAADMGDLYSPFLETGYGANDSLNRLIADPSSVRSLPGYQFDLGEGINALDRSAAARGTLNSGRTAKDVMRFATGLADKTYGDQFARLTGATTGVGGMGAAGTSAGLQGQLGARTTAFGGDMNAAGTIGQGMVAGAQARQSALGNLLGTVSYLGGSFLGGRKFG